MRFENKQVQLRNWCHYTFVDIAHLNRNMDSVKRMEFNKEFLYPSGGDFKDTGNLSEEANYVYTMMNPNDQKYNLTKHFGLDLTNDAHPYVRSIHLVESRDTECPLHLHLDMYGGIKTFAELQGY